MPCFFMVIVAACSAPRLDDTPDATSAGENVRIAESALGKALDSIAGFARDGGFAGAILVARGADILLSQGYGMAHAETRRLNTPLTVFDAGSLAKPFTAIAILQLVEAGKLRLDQTLETLFEQVPPDKRRITIHQLLTHTAGLQEYHGNGDFRPLRRADALKEILDAPLRFAPGSQYRYSNSGHTLLAMIIENVSGVPWTEYLKRHVFEPAGMEFTGFYGNQRWRPSGAAHGYDETGADRGSPLSWEGPYWALIGNGGVVTNVVDLLRWHRALRLGKLLDSRWVAQLTRASESSGRYVPNRYEGIREVAAEVRVSYFGWRWRGPDSVDVIEKGGAMDHGHTALFRYEPERDVVIIILSNRWVRDDQGRLLRVPLMDALHAAVVRALPVKDAV